MLARIALTSAIASCTTSTREFPEYSKRRNARLITRRFMYFWNLHANITFGNEFTGWSTVWHTVCVSVSCTIITDNISPSQASTPCNISTLKLKLNGKYLARIICDKEATQTRNQRRAHDASTIHIDADTLCRQNRHTHISTRVAMVCARVSPCVCVCWLYLGICGCYECDTIRPTVKDYIDSEAKQTMACN